MTTKKATAKKLPEVKQTVEKATAAAKKAVPATIEENLYKGHAIVKTNYGFGVTSAGTAKKKGEVEISGPMLSSMSLTMKEAKAWIDKATAEPKAKKQAKPKKLSDVTLNAVAAGEAKKVVAPRNEKKETKVGNKIIRKNNRLTLQLQASLAAEAPVTPLTKLLVKNGFVFAQSAQLEDERTTAHGYSHPNGSAALFIHDNTSTKIAARWQLNRADGTSIEGKTAQELATALLAPVGVSEGTQAALQLLYKLTAGSFRAASLVGEENYTNRVQLLKKLKGTDKILVKESGVKNLLAAFSAALGEEATEEACGKVFRQVQKLNNTIRTVEKEQVQDVMRSTVGQREVHDDKPILPGVKKLNNKKQKAADEKTKAELKAQIATKRKQEEYTPLAVPRPEAELSVDLEDVCLLEDPANGLVLMCLEKANSQGAICVYNNGSRVAAGVVPTEVLVTLRRLVSEDLVRDVNQLLHPLTAGVIVTPVAEHHLTAVLEHCKENLIMANETAVKTKKFAAPAKPNGKKEAAASKATKTPKVARAASAKGHTTERVKVVQDATATIALVKKPTEADKLAKRDRVIVDILAAAPGKKLVLSDLLKAMKKQIGGDRTMESIWSWHGSPRQILISGGFVAVK